MSGERPELWPNSRATPIAEAIYSAGACLTWVQAWDVAQVVLEIPEIRDAVAGDAARLRSLAARMDSQPNRGRSFTGAEVAAMLRDGDQ